MHLILDVTRVLKDKTSDLIPVLRSLGEQESPAPLSTPLKVVREGGVVSVNGHRVAKTLKGSEGLKTGQSYILFVHWSRDFKAYRLAGGMSGAVLVEPELLVRPLGSEKGVTRLRGTRLDTFLEEVLADQCILYSY